MTANAQFTERLQNLFTTSVIPPNHFFGSLLSGVAEFDCNFDKVLEITKSGENSTQFLTVGYMSKSDYHIEINSFTNSFSLNISSSLFEKIECPPKAKIFDLDANSLTMPQNSENLEKCLSEKSLIDCFENSSKIPLIYAFDTEKISIINCEGFPFHFDIKKTIFCTMSPDLRLLFDIDDSSVVVKSFDNRILENNAGEPFFGIVMKDINNKKRSKSKVIFDPLFALDKIPFYFGCEIDNNIVLDTIFVVWKNGKDLPKLYINRFNDKDVNVISSKLRRFKIVDKNNVNCLLDDIDVLIHTITVSK